MFAVWSTILLSYQLLAEPSIVIRPYSSIMSQGSLTLADVSEVSGVSPELVVKLKSVTLGNAPQIGEKRLFTNWALSEILKKEISALELDQVRWSVKIPSQVVVENRGFEISKEQVEKLLTAKWKMACGNCKFVFRYTSVPLVPETFRKAPWEVVVGSEAPKGSFSAQIKSTNPELSASAFWVTGQVEVHRLVPVAKRQLNIGERVTAEDLNYDYRDVSFARDGSPQVSDLVGRRLRQGLAASEILWLSMLEKEKALHRGDTVNVTTHGSSFQVSLVGRAEQDGYVGDHVNVRNLSSNKVLTGRVMENGEVTLE